MQYDKDVISPATRRENSEDIGRNASANPTMGDVIARRYSRRSVIRGSLAVAAIGAIIDPLALIARNTAQTKEASSFEFEELGAGSDETHHVANGYRADILLRWGDKIFPGSPSFNSASQSATAQAKQFGYNNDFVGFIPIDGANDRGLLVVNHEYTNPELMFPNFAKIENGEVSLGRYTKDLVDIEIAAHGGTIIEIRKIKSNWHPVLDSYYNRRITAATEMELSGPVAGHDRVKTYADPSGKKVFGTLNNCAGGLTPWGTYLMAEENINGYFNGRLADGHVEFQNHSRMGIPDAWYDWGSFYDRFDVSKEPLEPNRFGWIVEVDPFEPTSIPKKRTALGRFKHEGCETVVSPSGRVVAYSGDDERFEYVYKFVSKGVYDSSDRMSNKDLLDEGTLYVARFDVDGTVDWLPLVYGRGPLKSENGFMSQADVLIETRRAADLLGATKMDRPEDIVPNPATGKVYVMLTNNTRRTADNLDAANPRSENAFGHIIEISEPDGDFTSKTSRWEILLKCGDPSIAHVGATFSPSTSENGWFGMPDNGTIDTDGRLWVATDGNSKEKTGRTDGLWAVETEGPERGRSMLFFRVPIGAEMCGPCFTPDGEALFLSVQHPAEGGSSTYEYPSTRWPDFDPNIPARPAVVVVTKLGGGKLA
ncbi:PhoX family protein [Phyllobacterium leguminum]|uniref:dTDP-glucose 4,6-dehydratase n=1 Tax=Phyllobacterium leguminum TaxID=314237 RepID=A0A318SZ61_9HYPH|nr:PhoX family phosphatase [Phyllobacterium leguminum]PYE86674.1 hypothetical protein C7477_12139 [Phyllobacterium leguminum]